MSNDHATDVSLVEEQVANLTFQLELFKMSLRIAPGEKQINKSLKELALKIPKRYHETLKVLFDVAKPDGTSEKVLIQEIVGTKAKEYGFKPFQNKADAVDFFTKWADKALSQIALIPRDLLEVTKGRNSEAEKVTFNGETRLIAEFAIDFVAGSKLAEYLAGSIKVSDMSHDELSALNRILSVIKTGTHQIIPDDVRSKYFGKKKKEKVGNTEPVENDDSENDDDDDSENESNDSESNEDLLS
jgi:hypothetical protein